MFKKISKIFLTSCMLLGIIGVSACTLPSGDSSSGGEEKPPVVNPIKENEVKIKSIKATETVEETEPVAQKMSARRMSAPKKLNNENSSNDGIMTIDEENKDNINYIIIYKSQTDITFTITLDNPEAYGIDALRVTCDDENAQIQVDGDWKPIAQETDGTRVVNWSSEDPYTKTYNIRTTSEDSINSFKVVDVRLAGHEKFQSKETEDKDLGNNELHIYKMDEDAYTLNVIENTFDHIKFNFTVKDEYKDIISNIKVDGLEIDKELGYWVLYESKEVEITYLYKISEYGIDVKRTCYRNISLLDFKTTYDYELLAYVDYWNNCNKYICFGFEINDTFSIYYDNIELEFSESVIFYEGNYRLHYYLFKADCLNEVMCNMYIEGFNDITSLDKISYMDSVSNILFKSKDDIDDFFSKLSIVIYNKTYKFKYKIHSADLHYVYDINIVEE